MRILQLVTIRQRRGAEVFATQLSDALTNRGHEVLVLGLLPAPERALTPESADFRDLQCTSNGRLSVRRLAEASAAVRRFGPDIVQANGSQTLKYGSLVKRTIASDIPLVYRNISMASDWVRKGVHRAWGRWLVRTFDHISSVSEQSSQDFAEVYRVPAHRLSVIRRGILIPECVRGSEARAELISRTGTPSTAQLLAHVGSFTEEKNHEWLVDVFSRLAEKNLDAHLVFIGEGALRSKVESQIGALDLQNRVHVLGMQPNAAQLVAGADLFVLPSRIEGIPGAVLEAAAQGVPAVATNVGGMREAIVNGTTGLLVSPGDTEAFEDAILGLLADHTYRQRLGEAARSFVQKNFSMDTAADKFESLYERLVTDPAQQVVNGCA